MGIKEKFIYLLAQGKQLFYCRLEWLLDYLLFEENRCINGLSFHFGDLLWAELDNFDYSFYQTNKYLKMLVVKVALFPLGNSQVGHILTKSHYRDQ